MERKKWSTRPKTVKNDYQQSKPVDMVKIVVFFFKSKQSTTIKNGQILSKTVENGQNWSKTVKNN